MAKKFPGVLSREFFYSSKIFLFLTFAVNAAETPPGPVPIIAMSALSLSLIHI